MVLDRRAFVVRAARRVGSDDEKLIVSRKALVACASRQNNHVAGLQREDPPVLATEPDATLATRDAERFMDSRVVVHVVVDAVTPGITPSVRFEQVFDYGRGVLAVIQSDCSSIDNERPPRMIWDKTVVLEADRVRLSHSREAHGLPFAWASKTGCALRVSLQVFKGWHDRSP